MEADSDATTLMLIDRAIVLLENNDEERRADVMRNLKNNFLESKDRKESCWAILRGMVHTGGKDELVLYRDGKYLIEENEQLEDALNMLFEECKRRVTEGLEDFICSN